MSYKFIFSLRRILGAVVLIVVAVWVVASQPSFSTNQKSGMVAYPDRLKYHVEILSRDFHPRNWRNPGNLTKCAEFIHTEFAKAGAKTDKQVFSYNGNIYQNVLARFGPDNGKRLIIGAHYDSYHDTPGADDNASGVAALIELAHMLGKTTPTRPIELVAYTLEEPPFFRTAQMGSAFHAKHLDTIDADVLGVIILEMVGYYSDEPFSQSYPSLLLRLMYPSRGNFLAVVGKWDQGSWIKRVKTGMKGTTDLPIRSIRAPTILPGIDFSDHLNYWAKGYDAIMLTDTAFYRNKAYHSTNDTPDRLDYDRMGQAVIAAYEMVKGL